MDKSAVFALDFIVLQTGVYKKTFPQSAHLLLQDVERVDLHCIGIQNLVIFHVFDTLCILCLIRSVSFFS